MSELLKFWERQGGGGDFDEGTLKGKDILNR